MKLLDRPGCENGTDDAHAPYRNRAIVLQIRGSRSEERTTERRKGS